MWNSPPRDRDRDLPCGVFPTRKGKFAAKIMGLYLGTFTAPKEASAAYIDAAQDLYGEFYRKDWHMTAHEFNNQSDQAERQAIVKNDSYFSRQQNAIDDAGGRYARLTPSKLTGSTPSYPQQPSTSPWSQSLDEVSGPEGPLGYEIDAQPELGGAPALPCAETATPNEGSDGAGVVTPQLIRRRDW